VSGEKTVGVGVEKGVEVKEREERGEEWKKK
jgi:hypothetical protein